MSSFFSRIFSRQNQMLSPTNGLVNSVRLEHEKIQAGSHKVNNLERRFLVWTGKYKKIEDVPNFLSQSTVERARNRMRIKIANYMMLATALCSLAMVYSGKQARKRGESVTQQNLDWHKEINEGKQ